jgi:hypothetical protein
MDIKDRRGDVDATDTAMNNVECTGSAVGDDEGHLQDPVTILGSAREISRGRRLSGAKNNSVAGGMGRV